MKKILIGLAATAMLATPLAVTASAEAVTTAGIDYGTPYVTHGTLGESHIRGGEWAITSKTLGTGASFTTNGGVPTSLSSTLTAKNTPITRWRIVFDAVSLDALNVKVDTDGLPTFGTSLGGGFHQGGAFQSGDKVVVLIYAVGDKTA